MIVLDHHQVSNPAPDAVALVNPQLAGENGTSFRELCSAGLAFKLAHALVKRGRETDLPGAAEFDLKPLLDLVALGTIADLVPLIGENRILVSAGLRQLNETRRAGILALKTVAQIAAENRRLRSRLSTCAAIERRRSFGNRRRIFAFAARQKFGRSDADRAKSGFAKSRAAEN